jgi:hypothetical protein
VNCFERSINILLCPSSQPSEREMNRYIQRLEELKLVNNKVVSLKEMLTI